MGGGHCDQIPKGGGPEGQCPGGGSGQGGHLPRCGGGQGGQFPKGGGPGVQLFENGECGSEISVDGGLGGQLHVGGTSGSQFSESGGLGGRIPGCVGCGSQLSRGGGLVGQCADGGRQDGLHPGGGLSFECSGLHLGGSNDIKDCQRGTLEKVEVRFLGGTIAKREQ
ncbi:glycine-rich cell wall structural protein-like [Raphanus sativus]|uniref:Glycine-rich cell wall structural protein-like n=1 Tax=Raphanus sativus TaxID=3726 RepID=A0A6J0N6A0_RAPSA|nr:glycine-rich cell wall structural protein-like [Raphanus sativus]